MRGRIFISILMGGVGMLMEGTAPVLLTRVVHYQGELIDTYVCYFNRDPDVISDPLMPSEPKKSISCFLPHTTITPAAQRDIAALSYTVDHTGGPAHLQYEPLTQPMSGLQLTLTYNAANYTCNKVQSHALSGQHTLTFNSYNTQALSAARIRWYAQIVHQPRVALACVSGYRHSKHRAWCQGLMANLTHACACKGLELPDVHKTVFLPDKSYMVATSSNLIARADALIVLVCGARGPLCVEMLAPHTHRSITGLQKLDTFERTLRLEASRLAQVVTGRLKLCDEQVVCNRVVHDPVLLGAEMPAIVVHVPLKSNAQALVSALADGLHLYFKKSGFSGA